VGEYQRFLLFVGLVAAGVVPGAARDLIEHLCRKAICIPPRMDYISQMHK
jgi:hypothetical protein